MKVYARTNQTVLSWCNSVKGTYSLCLSLSHNVIIVFFLSFRNQTFAHASETSFCSNVFEISSNNKNKVDGLLKGLASADDPHVCNIMIKQMTNSPLFTLLKHFWHWDAYDSSSFSANMHMIHVHLNFLYKNFPTLSTSTRNSLCLFGSIDFWSMSTLLKHLEEKKKPLYFYLNLDYILSYISWQKIIIFHRIAKTRRRKLPLRKNKYRQMAKGHEKHLISLICLVKKQILLLISLISFLSLWKYFFHTFSEL